MSQRTSSTEAVDPRQAGSDQLFLAEGAAAALSKPLQLEVPASSVLQSSAVQPPKTPAVAAPGAARPLGSFLGKSLAEDPTARASPRNEQLSTRQAQEVADAAAAGTYRHKHTGALSAQEGQRSSMNGEGVPSSTAAAVPNAIKNLKAGTLQPPKTSELKSVRWIVRWGLHLPVSLRSKHGPECCTSGEKRRLNIPTTNEKACLTHHASANVVLCAGSEFEKVWKSLRDDRGSQATYLRMLKDVSLGSLFKRSLTGTLLSSVLACLLEDVAAADEDLSVELLRALAKVPRFEIVMMCVSQQEKAKLHTAWDQAASRAMDSAFKAELCELQKHYKL